MFQKGLVLFCGVLAILMLRDYVNEAVNAERGVSIMDLFDEKMESTVTKVRQNKIIFLKAQGIKNKHGKQKSESKE
ncbi:MAG: hypothetical protein ACK5JF_04570 [Oscillospiraceae bacterium]